MIMNLFTKSFLIDIQDIQSIKNSELITFNETILISGQDYHPLDKVIDFLKVIKEKRVGSFFFIPLNIDMMIYCINIQKLKIISKIYLSIMNLMNIFHY